MDKSEPQIDSSQDWELLAGNETATHTILKFRRKFETCDDKDLNIEVNVYTLRFLAHESLIWSDFNIGESEMQAFC